MDHIAIPNLLVLGQGAAGGGDRPAETGRPVASVVVETPVIVAEPRDSAGRRLTSELRNDRSVQFLSEQDECARCSKRWKERTV